MIKGACQTVIIGGEISFVLPDNITLTYDQINAICNMVDDFILWEMNEVVRQKTGVPCYYGTSIQELVNAEKKESFY